MIDPKLIQLVHDQNAMEALNAYLTERVEALKESLVMAADTTEVVRLQSAIQELRKLMNLKKTVLAKRT